MKRGFPLSLLLIAGIGSTAGADLGRLFFTPAQRATLDSARQQNVRTDIGNDDSDQAAPLPQNITVNGMVRRSDGKTTVWVNGRPITSGQSNAVSIVPAKNDNRVKLIAPDSGRSVNLKVGQTFELNNGAVEDTYSLHSAVPVATSHPENASASRSAPAEDAPASTPPLLPPLPTPQNNSVAPPVNTAPK